MEVLSVARELGLSVPGDLAIVGYDNTGYCDLAQNSLTSIDQSGQVLGLQAARLLIERIKGRDTPSISWSPRASSPAARRAAPNPPSRQPHPPHAGLHGSPLLLCRHPATP